MTNYGIKSIAQTVNGPIKKKEIGFNLSQSFSTPQRLVFFINGIPEKIEQKGKIIKGPKIEAPEQALDGFVKSNKLNRTDIYKEKIDKGEFYFAKTKQNKRTSRSCNTSDHAGTKRGRGDAKVDDVGRGPVKYVLYSFYVVWKE